MRVTLRAKLLAIVGTAALALVTLMITGELAERQVDRQLREIHDRHLPRATARLSLDAQFDRLRRALQDAVAAQDSEALEATHAVRDDLLERLSQSRGAIERSEAAALRRSVQDYYGTAYDVSRRLLAGETGERLVEGIAAMQAKQARTVEKLAKATNFDERELTRAFAAATRAQARASRIRLATSAACLGLVVLLSLWISRGVFRTLAQLTAGLQRFEKGEFHTHIPVLGEDELGDVARRANEMADGLARLGRDRDAADWLKSGQAGLAAELRGDRGPADAAHRCVAFLADLLDAPAAALYVREDGGTLRLLGHYAGSFEGTAVPRFRLGEGLVGQAALQSEPMFLADPPPDFLRIRSGLGESAARAVALVPLLHAGNVTGVLELGSFHPWPPESIELLRSVAEPIAIAIEAARAREDLRQTNEELQAQHEELRQTNDELARQAHELEQQRRMLEQRNADLGEARERLEEKATELSTVSAYKSQFLANMSHELRTPLNSMLLLSNLMAENQDGNLDARQVEFCRTIHQSGQDLLALINQVLDLAKIEAGKQEVRPQKVLLAALAERARRVFGPLAADRDLDFAVEIAPGLPDSITSDALRVEQILNNLLSNAIKFTRTGGVTLRIVPEAPGQRFRRHDLRAERALAFVVVDTGVGIATGDLERIFAPFEQVGVGDDRRAGGTGLGLAIARELASILGGELRVESTPGGGSTFTCTLPHEIPDPASGASRGSEPSRTRETRRTTAPPRTAVSDGDDRHARADDEAFLLVIEDDPAFASVLVEIIHAQGLKAWVETGGSAGLEVARRHRPAGIVLDVVLPDLDGWAVMESLQADPTTADIPVHFISAVDGQDRGLRMGAVGYLTKPVSRSDLVRVVQSLAPRRLRRSRRILVVDPDRDSAEALVEWLAGEGMEAERVGSGAEAIEALDREPFGCLILDPTSEDAGGSVLLEALERRFGPDRPSVIVHTGRALSKDEVQRLDRYAEAVVLKEGASTERLLDEIRLFVRRLKENLGPMPHAPGLAAAELRLEGRRILVVDDDMRTVYALSAMLRSKGAEVEVADTGRTAIDVLDARPGIEAVLMDVMMPEMDGYTAMRKIREDARFRALPIIALTAKAMKGDEAKCLEAGASGYLAKPIDASRLLGLLQTHLGRRDDDG